MKTIVERRWVWWLMGFLVRGEGGDGGSKAGMSRKRRVNQWWWWLFGD